MGILALGNMLIALFAAVAIFQAAKAAFGMPAILNLPGAFSMFFAVISLSGWATHDLFDGYLHMPAPNVPWNYWLIYLSISIGWYAVMVWLLAQWRRTVEHLSNHTSTQD